MNQQLLAAVDIGSNTVQLLIAAVEDKAIVSRRSRLWTTRLGEAGPEGRLSACAIRDTSMAVAEAMEAARAAGVSRARITATSAVRDAANSQELTAAIAAAAPLAPPVEILSGVQEAELSWRGARCCVQAPANWPVIDQGGSSTELIYDVSGQLQLVSRNIGAVRAHTLGWSREEISRRVAQGFTRLNQARGAIGVGGCITTAAGVLLKLSAYERDAVEGYPLGYSEIEGLLKQLSPLSIRERCAYSPLLERRGEVMTEGLVIWLSLMEALELETVVTTGGGLPDGAIMQMTDEER